MNEKVKEIREWTEALMWDVITDKTYIEARSYVLTLLSEIERLEQEKVVTEATTGLHVAVLEKRIAELERVLRHVGSNANPADAYLVKHALSKESR